MSKQPPPAPTASTVSLCPTIIQISRSPWHWKLTQHHRTTRPPPVVKAIIPNITVKLEMSPETTTKVFLLGFDSSKQVSIGNRLNFIDVYITSSFQ